MRRRLPLVSTFTEPHANGSLHPRPALVYDGDCAFCQRAVSAARRALPALPAIVDGRRDELRELALDRDDASRSAWLVLRDGARVRHLEGADAIGEVLRHQPSPAYRFAGHLLGIPPIGLAAQAGYRLVAANRHRLPGGTADCALPAA